MTTSHKQTALSLSTVVSEIVFLNIFFLKIYQNNIIY